jgi:hypothetical protein
MRTKGAVVAVALGGLLAGGCIQGQRAIKVNADGSGTVVDTTKLIGMAAAMGEMGGQSSSAQAKVNREVEIKKKATAQGLTFVSSEKTADGAERVTYSFKDITKTSMNRSADMPNENKDEKDGASAKEEQLVFRLARSGDKSTLTVVVPKDKAADKKSDKPAEAKKPSPEEEKQAMAMMKGMLAGLKLATVVEVNGKIVKTTAPYPPVGSVVTLMEMDFDQMGDEGLAKLASLQDQPGPPTPEQLKGLKGVKFTEGEIVIEFSGK